MQLGLPSLYRLELDVGMRDLVTVDPNHTSKYKVANGMIWHWPIIMLFSSIEVHLFDQHRRTFVSLVIVKNIR